MTPIIQSPKFNKTFSKIQGKWSWRPAGKDICHERWNMELQFYKLDFSVTFGSPTFFLVCEHSILGRLILITCSIYKIKLFWKVVRIIADAFSNVMVLWVSALLSSDWGVGSNYATDQDNMAFRHSFFSLSLSLKSWVCVPQCIAVKRKKKSKKCIYSSLIKSRSN